MDLHLHDAIAGRLEASKAAGWLSEYLVAWHGPSGKLAPNVTVWSATGRADEAVRDYVAGALAGLVGAASIFVANG
jgi:hypothetical protein